MINVEKSNKWYRHRQEPEWVILYLTMLSTSATCFGKINYIKSENKFHINVCLTKYESEIFKWIIDTLYMSMKVSEKSRVST